MLLDAATLLVLGTSLAVGAVVALVLGRSVPGIVVAVLLVGGVLALSTGRAAAEETRAPATTTTIGTMVAPFRPVDRGVPPGPDAPPARTAPPAPVADAAGDPGNHRFLTPDGSVPRLPSCAITYAIGIAGLPSAVVPAVSATVREVVDAVASVAPGLSFVEVGPSTAHPQFGVLPVAPDRPEALLLIAVQPVDQRPQHDAGIAGHGAPVLEASSDYHVVRGGVARAWLDVGPSARPPGWDPDGLAAVVLHELLHALGVHHAPVDDGTQIMGGRGSDDVRMGAGDVAALRAISARCAPSAPAAP